MAFDAEHISCMLAEMGYHVVVAAFPSAGSTNDEARSMVSAGSAHVMAVADHQTKGRGSHGRSFYSPDGTGFYMTFSVPDADPGVQMTLAAGVAAVQAIEEVCQRKVGIKWVNDLIYLGRKFCGILCERMADGTVLVGIGINMQAPKGGFPDDLSETAAALDVDMDLADRLAASIYIRFMELIGKPTAVLPLYRESCITLGREITFIEDGKEQRGLAADVEEDGSLIVIHDGKRKRFYSGEISVRMI